MKVILLLLVSWSLTAWSEQPLTTEEFMQLRLKSYERFATKYALLLDDKETGFEDYCDKEFAAAENANDPIFDKPDWPEKIAERVMEKYFRRKPKEGMEQQVVAEKMGYPIQNEEFITFSTVGLPKSAGSKFTIKYPKSWASEEASGADFRYFVSENGVGVDTIHFFADVTPVEISPQEFRDAWTEGRMKARLPTGAVFISGKHLQVDGLPAVLVESNQTLIVNGKSEHVRLWALTFLQGRSLISISFVVASLNGDGSDLEERATKLKPLFDKMIQSIKSAE